MVPNNRKDIVKKIIGSLGNIKNKDILVVGQNKGDISKDIKKNCELGNVVWNLLDSNKAIGKGRGRKILPYKDGQFDIIICSCLVEYAPYANDIISEFKRIIKPPEIDSIILKGGILISPLNELDRTKHPFQDSKGTKFMSSNTKVIYTPYGANTGMIDSYLKRYGFWKEWHTIIPNGKPLYHVIKASNNPPPQITSSPDAGGPSNILNVDQHLRSVYGDDLINKIIKRK